MKDIIKLLEGDSATFNELTRNNYDLWGYHLGDPIYENTEGHKIVVKDEKVVMEYTFNVWNGARGL